MSDILSNRKLRSKSAHPRNFKNVELHACLDQAKAYKDQVEHHFIVSKFQNHVLESAERFYHKQQTLRPSSSHTSLNRKNRLSARSRSKSKADGLSTGFQFTNASKHRTNPENTVMNGLEQKAYRISEIKAGFRAGQEQKDYLKSRMQYLKQRIVQQKNKKAKISIRNCKWMNAAQLSQFNINNLMQRSRRNEIHINEVQDDVTQLQRQNNKLQKQNAKLRQEIDDEDNNVDILTKTVSQLRRELDRQRKLLEMWKEKQTIEYKQMTNKYMVMNQLKEQKAFLLNSIDLDYKNSNY